MSSFKIILPTSEPVPILLSIPHCGTAFPDELKSLYRQDLIQNPDDTDWVVDQLYSFAAEMGITTIVSIYSRWIIDLNRHPESKPLYNDGRIITGLCPTTDFLGNSIYQDNRTELAAHDINNRLEKFYWPYHHELQRQIQSLQGKFGKVLLWDCHSIRQEVLTIQKEKFPDLILGDADGTSASPGIIETATKVLESSGYRFSHNHPFKGGYITRQYGKPSNNVHALQLEMTKVNYMNDDEHQFNSERALRMQGVLRRALSQLIETILSV